MSNIVNRRQARRSPPIGVHEGQVCERHEGGHRLAGPLDDDALPRSCLVDDLAEPATHVKCRHDSHGTIIALYESRAPGLARGRSLVLVTWINSSCSANAAMTDG